MKGKKENSEILFQKATEQYNKSCSVKESHFSEADALSRLQELEVEQIKLEMIIEEQVLCQQKESVLANKKYSDLYDFSPSGYFTLTSSGKILELNIAGAQILGRERSMLKNHLFGFFVSPESKQIFNVFIGNIFIRKAKESCVLTLNSVSDFQCYVSVTGISIGNREQCIITVVNITDRKRAERDLIDANKALFFQNEEKTKRAVEGDKISQIQSGTVSNQAVSGRRGIRSRRQPAKSGTRMFPPLCNSGSSSIHQQPGPSLPMSNGPPISTPIQDLA